MGRYNFIDNTRYFMDKVKEIMHKDYRLSTEDRLKMRISASDHEVFTLNLEDFAMFEFHDFGGSRNERNKWYTEWNKVDAVIFCAGLDQYCKSSIEDGRKNAMMESIELFGEIMNHKCHKTSEIFLFLTKYDGFREYLRFTPLMYCFKITKSTVLFWINKL